MNWQNIFKGIAMGSVETVPGVSSSTIAMLLGIYESIIGAINDLTTNRYKRAVLFLFPIGIGILLGAAFSVVVVKYLLDTYPGPTHFLFIGLILGMLPFIWRSGHGLYGLQTTYKGYHFVLMLVFFFITASLNLFVHPNQSMIMNVTMSDYIYLFVSGWLASIALVLPGISGALILMIVGAYYTALNALITLNIPIIITLVAGIIIGILLTGKFVRYLLEHFRQGTYAAIIGLLSGSLVILYPGFPTQVNELIASVLLLFVGFFFALFVSKR